jgi:hypothetical protein
VPVRVDEPGEHRAPGEVDHARRRAAQRQRAGGVADEGEAVAAHR